MYACMTPVGFDTSDKFENHCSKWCGRFTHLNLLCIVVKRTMNYDSGQDKRRTV